MRSGHQYRRREFSRLDAAAGVGWAAGYAFAGMRMAYAVVYLADNFLWPAAALRRIRAR